MIDYNEVRFWAFREARKLQEHVANKLNKKEYVLFETGFGPSGLPHIGTFGEVLRTTLVQKAFEKISEMPTRLIVFSDDMDALRKVPNNLPNQAMLTQHIGYPLTSVPDPFGTHESFAHHNNAKLREFIDKFGFKYEFKSATEEYKSGRFDNAILSVLRNYDQIMSLMLPTLGKERQATYSPLLPISPATGKVLMVPLESVDSAAGTIRFRDEFGHSQEIEVTRGNCKLQWKADWAMRWAAQDVDYEMSGRDLAPTVDLSHKICGLIGGIPPTGMIYELFVDENGQKISKTKGNGLTVEQWQSYGLTESMAYFIAGRPNSGAKLHMGSIRQSTREYFNDLAKYVDQTPQERLDNTIWHIHAGNPPAPPPKGIDYDLIINLASVSSFESSTELTAALTESRNGVDEQDSRFVEMIEKGMRYYTDQIKPYKNYRLPTEAEKLALYDLKKELAVMPATSTDEELQTVFYSIGKQHFGKKNLYNWFQCVYETLLGQTEGPRMGGFVKIYGLDKTLKLIDDALVRKPINTSASVPTQRIGL